MHLNWFNPLKDNSVLSTELITQIGHWKEFQRWHIECEPFIICSDKGPTPKIMSVRSIFIINSVNSTKLPCYTLPLMQHHSFFRNLPPLPAQQSSTQHELQEKKDSSVLINKIYVTECYPWVLSPFNTGQRQKTRKQHLFHTIIHHLFYVEFM